MSHRNPADRKAWQQNYDQSHREERRAYQRDYRVKHLEEQRAYHQAYRDAHREEIRTRGQEYRKKHLEERRNYNRIYGQQYRDRIRKEVFSHYGGAFCCCCGESTFEFLSIDHIAGGGNQHRKTMSNHLDLWLRNNHFPSGFRVLCMNCNFALGRHGYCPHNNVI